MLLQSVTHFWNRRENIPMQMSQWCKSPPTAGVLWVVICRRRWSKASLADTVFPTECDTVSSRKGLSAKQATKKKGSREKVRQRLKKRWRDVKLLANGAHEAARMVALPQNCHHFSFHKLPAVVAGRAVEPLEVKWTEAVPVLHEEASPSQVTATHCTQWEEDVSGLFI